MREPMIFDDWTVTDEDGFVCGVREDAPDEVKNAYEEYMAKLEEMKKLGIKIPRWMEKG